MRVISGQFKGKKLLSPSGDNVRPTTDRIKESIFNILANKVAIEGSTVLDLFCGSGALGIESLSRGASRAIFVDNNPASIKLTKHNLAQMGKIAITTSFQENRPTNKNACKSQNSIDTIQSLNQNACQNTDHNVSQGVEINAEEFACDCSQNCCAEIFNTSFEVAIKKFLGKKFNIIFIDPPYFDNLGDKSISLIDKYEILTEGGIIIYEHYGKIGLSIDPKKYIIDARTFGSVSVSFIMKNID